MDNKKLYESIMANVAKLVKKAINEEYLGDDFSDDDIQWLGPHDSIEDIDRVWEAIVDREIATEKEVELVTSINGKSMNTLNDIIYVRTGYRNLEQLIESEGE